MIAISIKNLSKTYPPSFPRVKKFFRLPIKRFDIKFTRQIKDELLGTTIALLTQKGARIFDVETEKATLPDVLESYDD